MPERSLTWLCSMMHVSHIDHQWDHLTLHPTVPVCVIAHIQSFPRQQRVLCHCLFTFIHRGLVRCLVCVYQISSFFFFLSVGKTNILWTCLIIMQAKYQIWISPPQHPIDRRLVHTYCFLESNKREKNALVGMYSRCKWKVMRWGNKGCGWMNRVLRGWASVPENRMSLKEGYQWVRWLMDRWRKCVERRGGRAEGLYLPAASPHRNSCLSDCNRCRFTEGVEMVWQLLLVFPLLLFSCWIKYRSVSLNNHFPLWKDTYLHSFHQNIWRAFLPSTISSVFLLQHLML